MDAVVSHVPKTVIDYVSAVEKLSSGQFTSRFTEEGRQFFASLYGAPFFAINQLAPETSGNPGLNLLIASSISSLAADGGRWLSLYAKAFEQHGKLSCTVCINSRPRAIKPPKPLLFQLPQQVLLKNWSKHLRDLDISPDLVLLYVPDGFEAIEATVQELSHITAGRKSLLASHSRAEAILVRKLLDASGFKTSEPLAFNLSKDKAQDFASGAWWISAVAPEDGRLIPLEADTRGTLRRAYDIFRGFIRSAKDREDLNQTAAIYATRSTETVGDKDGINAIRISSLCGVDLASGRLFSKKDNATEFSWDDRILSFDPLSPEDAPELTADDSRYLRMAWLGAALSLEAPSEVNAQPSAIDVVAIAETDTQPSQEITTVSGVQLPPTPLPASHAPAIHETGTIKPATTKQRSRLSRSAGTVNVLALAALLGKAGQGQDKSFESARSKILHWLKGKGFAIPSPSDNSHIELPNGEVSVETDGQSVWALRFDDRKSMEEGAFWRVEATLLSQPPAIGLRLVQIRRTEEAPPPVASGVPQVVATLAKDVGLIDSGIPLRNAAMLLVGEKDARELDHLLLNAGRTQPIIVVCAADSTKVDPSVDRLAARLTGVAHVACVDKFISEQMIRRYGRDRSVYGNAIRLYRPGFRANADPYQHPVWALKGTQLSKWISDDIFEEACAISLEVGDLDERVPSFHAIRSLLSEKRLESLRQQTKSIASTAEEKISQLDAIRRELESSLSEYKNQNAELKEQVHQLGADLQATRHERDEAKDEIRQLRYQLTNRWDSDDSPQAELTDESYYPDNWDELELWIEEYGEDKLVLHPQAIKAAQESPFKDIPFAYKALEYLVRHYVPMRTRDKDDTQAYLNSQQALAELGLELSKVGTALDDSRYKQEYRRQYEGRSIWLDDHLKKGAGFDPAVIFRLYFHYDEATAKVVVGHLPTHLTNRITHSG